MRKIALAGIILIGSALCILLGQIVYLLTFAPKEKYPDDTYWQREQNKTALIVVAHDDDAIMFSGTTSLLAANGWSVNFLCFYTDLYRAEDNPTRKVEMHRIAKIQGLNSLELMDISIARDTSKIGYMPIPYEEFQEHYNIDTLSTIINETINKYASSIIFTLDNVIGYYGHPEHVLIGQVVEDICQSNKDSPGFPVKKIYQVVCPPSMIEKSLAKKGTYQSGKEIYHCDGMPEPDIQIDISDFATTKKRVLLAHASQHRNIKKYVPYYRIIPGWIYWRIFKYEYFKIVSINS